MTVLKTPVYFIAGSLIIGAIQANASTITTLFDTGVNSSGTSLPDGTNPDPHYTIVSNVDGSPTDTATVKTSASGFPVGPWLGDSTTSAWIIPSEGYPGKDVAASNFDYQTTFTLPVGATSVSITANAATDNEGIDVLVNGVAAGTGSYNGFGAYVPITINSSNVVGGVNTLTFITHNDGGPGGFRVDGISGTFAVPEPASMSLLGLSGLGLLARRRRA